MEVEIKEFMAGDQRVDMDRVFVDGRLAGYVPIDGEWEGVFHPLSGFPRDKLAAVVAASDRLRIALQAPIPHEQLEDEEDDEPKDMD